MRGHEATPVSDNGKTRKTPSVRCSYSKLIQSLLCLKSVWNRQPNHCSLWAHLYAAIHASIKSKLQPCFCETVKRWDIMIIYCGQMLQERLDMCVWTLWYSSPSLGSHRDLFEDLSINIQEICTGISVRLWMRVRCFYPWVWCSVCTVCMFECILWGFQ